MYRRPLVPTIGRWLSNGRLFGDHLRRVSFCEKCAGRTFQVLPACGWPRSGRGERWIARWVAGLRILPSGGRPKDHPGKTISPGRLVPRDGSRETIEAAVSIRSAILLFKFTPPRVQSLQMFLRRFHLGVCGYQTRAVAGNRWLLQLSPLGLQHLFSFQYSLLDRRIFTAFQIRKLLFHWRRWLRKGRSSWIGPDTCL